MTLLLRVMIIMFVGWSAMASSTTIKQIDNVQNSIGGSSISVPSVGVTFATDTNTLTLSGKTISGASNTLSNIPVSAQMVNDIFYGNGTTTTFTLSFTPPAAAGVVVYVNGIALIQGSGLDYTISTNVITLVTAPVSGQRLLVNYSKF